MKHFSKNSQLLEPLQNVEVFHTPNNLDTVMKVTYVLRTRDEGTEAHLHVENSTNNHEHENREKTL